MIIAQWTPTQVLLVINLKQDTRNTNQTSDLGRELPPNWLGMFTPGGATLNKRDELFGFCKHRWKKLLSKQKT